MPTPARQLLDAGLIDAFTLHFAPALLGADARLFDSLGPGNLALEQLDVSHSRLVTHVGYRIVRPRPNPKH